MLTAWLAVVCDCSAVVGCRCFFRVGCLAAWLVAGRGCSAAAVVVGVISRWLLGWLLAVAAWLAAGCGCSFAVAAWLLVVGPAPGRGDDSVP